MPTIVDQRSPLIIYNPNTLSFGLWDGSISVGSVVIGAVTQSGAWAVTANAGTNLNTSLLALEAGNLASILAKLNASLAVTGTFFQATQPISAASLPLPTSAATEATLAAMGGLSDLFKTRQDTFTGTGNGTTVTVTTAPLSSFGIQVKGTGASATTWDIRLEGSLDGANFSQILAHTNTTGDGAVLWAGGVFSPALHFRSRVSGLVLGGASNVVVTILGMR